VAVAAAGGGRPEEGSALRGSLRLEADDASGARTRTRKLVRGDERRAMHEQLLSAIDAFRKNSASHDDYICEV
jgi:hypothetical protein